MSMRIQVDKRQTTDHTLLMKRAKKGGNGMDKPGHGQQSAFSPPSHEALRSAYDLILREIWPRIVAVNQTTSRRTVHEDTTDPERNTHSD